VTVPQSDGDLPSLPRGAEVTAWRAALPAGMTLTPRLAVVVLMHATWLRWLEMSALLQSEVEESGIGGVIGNVMASGRGGLYATQEQVRGLAQLEGEERDRIARLAKQLYDMGVTGSEDW
jgi:hypothetical protein